MELYGFWRSLATYRVRIALNLKGVDVTETMIDLDAGQQHESYMRVFNPMRAVPVLKPGDGTTLTQSLAILEWIEETYPDPPLMPAKPFARARVRALCAITVADSHPLVVPRVQAYLSKEWGIDEAKRTAWNAHWFRLGLEAYEARLGGTGPFCGGDTPGLADCCLASHVAGAERFKVDLAPYVTVGHIHRRCMAMPEFSSAHPLKQPGAPG